MKNIIMKLSVIAAMGLIGSAASAGTSSAQMAENFKTCNADYSWHQRWGQYVVGYDLAQAYNTCRDMYWPERANARVTGCNVDGQNLMAGYYCQESFHH